MAGRADKVPALAGGGQVSTGRADIGLRHIKGLDGFCLAAAKGQEHQIVRRRAARIAFRDEFKHGLCVRFTHLD